MPHIRAFLAHCKLSLLRNFSSQGVPAKSFKLRRYIDITLNLIDIFYLFLGYQRPYSLEYCSTKQRRVLSLRMITLARTLRLTTDVHGT
jgi:hypothetical protein